MKSRPEVHPTLRYSDRRTEHWFTSEENGLSIAGLCCSYHWRKRPSSTLQGTVSYWWNIPKKGRRSRFHPKTDHRTQSCGVLTTVTISWKNRCSRDRCLELSRQRHLQRLNYSNSLRKRNFYIYCPSLYVYFYGLYRVRKYSVLKHSDVGHHDLSMSLIYLTIFYCNSTSPNANST